MKMVSKLALAAVLSLGVVSTPALAQKKDDKAQPQLKVSEAFRKPASAAKAALDKRDWETADRELTAAEAVAQNPDEKWFAATMRFPIAVHKQDGAAIIAAADVLIADPRTPAANLGLYNFYRGQATFQAKKPAEALPFLLKAREQGMTEPDLALMLAQIYDDTGRRPEGIVEMGKAIEGVKARGEKPQESWYRWAVSRVAASGDRAALADWQLRQVRDFPTLANWRQIIIQYRNTPDKSGVKPDARQKLDLYRLLRGTGALADNNDYFEYASLAQSSGVPWEAIAVIAEGRAAKKIPAGDADFKTIEDAANNSIKNDQPLDTLAKNAKTAKDLTATADAYASQGKYDLAIPLYERALTVGGGSADLINLHLGVAMVNSGKKAEAKPYFAKVGPGVLGDIAKYWLLWMDLPTLS